MWGHMWGLEGGGWGWVVMGWIWMALFWGAIIWLVVWGVNRLSGGRLEGGESPLEIAKRRLARGEITKEQFEELREVLR